MVAPGGGVGRPQQLRLVGSWLQGLRPRQSMARGARLEGISQQRHSPAKGSDGQLSTEGGKNRAERMVRTATRI